MEMTHVLLVIVGLGRSGRALHCGVPWLVSCFSSTSGGRRSMGSIGTADVVWTSRVLRQHQKQVGLAMRILPVTCSSQMDKETAGHRPVATHLVPLRYKRLAVLMGEPSLSLDGR